MTTLLWILQPSDYLQCQSHAREIRHVQRRLPEGLPLTVFAVGGREDWAKSFLSRERVDARVIGMSLAEYQREFAAAPRSALYVMVGNKVQASISVVERREMEEGELLAILSRVDTDVTRTSTGGRAP